MKFSIELTWSKLIAFIVLISSIAIEIMSDRSGAVFMFSLPFVVFLITGKQLVDSRTANK